MRRGEDGLAAAHSNSEEFAAFQFSTVRDVVVLCSAVSYSESDRGKGGGAANKAITYGIY